MSNKPERVELARLTVDKLAEQLICAMRSGNGPAIVTIRVDGRNYDVTKLLVHRLPKELIVESVSDHRLPDEGARDLTGFWEIDKEKTDPQKLQLVSPDGQLKAFARADGRVEIWDELNEENIFELQVKIDQFTALRDAAISHFGEDWGK